MRVFVLCTGRCGSVTFSKACSHVNRRKQMCNPFSSFLEDNSRPFKTVFDSTHGLMDRRHRCRQIGEASLKIPPSVVPHPCRD